MGVVKWYHYGLQNRSSGFESLHPCKKNICVIKKRVVSLKYETERKIVQ